MRTAVLIIAALALVANLGCQSQKAKSVTPAVLNGIDALEAQAFEQLAGRRVGLITNHTGLNLTGKSTALLLHEARNLELVRLFSPEHGFHGVLEGKVGDAVHVPTGLKIHSLYTKERAPNATHLANIDTLVFDIQDIGCRFYTYISTMGEAMRVAAKTKLRFVVLDRPNPIGGVAFGGAMRDADVQSFVAWHNVPVRHGMTVGELAGMFDAELKLGCDLQVVKMRGWRRSTFFDATGQTWVNPSPNMRSPTQALLYPGVGLLETTNLSVGRGTDTPFELIGAPWMDGRKLAAALNAAKLPGVRCVPIRFTPTASKHKGEECSGVRFWITDRAVFDPIPLGAELACTLRRLHRDAWSIERYNRLLANREVLGAIRDGLGPEAVMHAIAKQLRSFATRRRRFLLYD